MDEIEKIIPQKLPSGKAISLGKRLARFKRDCCGINEDLLGPIQPERPNPTDHIVESNDMICDGLNTMET